MISLTSLALSLLAASTQQAPAPPLIRTITAPSSISTRPLSPEAKARQARYQRCRQAYLGQNYLPQPPIYRVSDADTTLYILGSIHSLPASFDWRSPALEKIVESSDRLITENGTEASLPGGPDALAFLRGQIAPATEPASTASPYVPLVERLEGERRAKWLGMKAAGPRVIMDWIDRQPDWRAAMSILGIASRLDDLTMSGGVETRLRADFKTAKKPIEALEQGKDVLAKLNALPPAVQRRLLLGALDLIGQPSQTGSYMTMITRWARGEEVTGSIESSLPSELRETLLDQRNAAWVPEVRKHLGPPGTRLIVVGAGHLAGRNNLIELLTAAGMKPVRYSRTGPPLPRPAFTPQPTRLTDCFSYLAAPPAPPPPPPPPRAQ